MDRLKSFFERVEVWFIENDLHIYFGVLTLVVVSMLGWMLYTETEKNKILRHQNITLLTIVSEKDKSIYDLNSQMDALKVSSTVSVPATPSRPVVETVDKVSNKLNDKIEKVQDSLIRSPSETKIITKTQLQTVEKPIPVDAELRSMMRQSFCTSFPTDKTCVKVKK